jgi:4-amino-4-deoxy-L-arabinose transferase-like glycosyltransferase
VTTQPAAVARREPGDLAAGLAASWHRIALGAVLGLAALLNLWRLDQNGYANTYYSAAVRSMTRSWHDFFFASFDPGGLVSVDKPPLALWLQAASAKALGYSGFAILLPEALAGVGAVWIAYVLAARYFGRVAGLVAALALAVSPVSVAVNRDNNPDALLALLLVAAAYAGARAVESGRWRWILACSALVGLAFEAKMLAAAVVVPGIVLAWLAFAPVAWPPRLGRLAAGAAVMVVVGGAWIAAVELTPAGSRPYVGSTSDNSALSLLLDYNGLGRVTGQTGGTSFGGGGLGGAFSGTPGLLRLFNDALGDQGAWLLPFALVGAVSLAIAAVRARRRVGLGVLAIVAGWFVSAAAIFSFSSGIIHTYYVSALAPATALLVGAGAVSLWRDARRGGLWILLPAWAVLGSLLVELDLLRRSGYQSWLQPVVVVGGLLAASACAGLVVTDAWPERVTRRTATVALSVGLGVLLLAPAAWSFSTWDSPVNGVFPGAGPSLVSGLGGGGGFGAPGGGATSGGTSDALDLALAYAEAHGAGGRWALIVSSEQEAAPAFIEGKPVASMGGFTGRETVLTGSYLASLVRSGEARYFLLGGGFGRGGEHDRVDLRGRLLVRVERAVRRVGHAVRLCRKSRCNRARRLTRCCRSSGASSSSASRTPPSASPSTGSSSRSASPRRPPARSPSPPAPSTGTSGTAAGRSGRPAPCGATPSSRPPAPD